MDKDPNPFPLMDILPHPLRRVGHALLELCRLHQLSPVSEHFQHPLDEVFDQPPYTEAGDGHEL